MADKKCSLCKTIKPLSDFHKSKARKDGHVSLCKVCANERRRQWQIDNKERAGRRAKEYYRQNRERLCNEAKEWRKNNREHMKQYMREYYQKNKESFLENCKLYYQKNKEMVNTRNREYHAANADKVRETSQRWYRRNAYKWREYWARRKAAKIQATPCWADRNELMRIYRDTPEGHEVDHIIPLQSDLVCGLHVPCNLQYLTISENRSKQNKLVV